MQRWSNVPVSTSLTIERIAKTDLPTLIGKNTRLDKRIAKILTKGSQDDYYWLFYDSIYGKKAPQLLISESVTSILKEYAPDCEEAEIEMEALSTGYWDPGRPYGPPGDCYPSEGEDERHITSIEITFFKDGKEKNHVVFTDEERACEFQSQFENELYKAELPEIESDY